MNTKLLDQSECDTFRQNQVSLGNLLESLTKVAMPKTLGGFPHSPVCSLSFLVFPRPTPQQTDSHTTTCSPRRPGELRKYMFRAAIWNSEKRVTQELFERLTGLRSRVSGEPAPFGGKTSLWQHIFR